MTNAAGTLEVLGGHLLSLLTHMVPGLTVECGRTDLVVRDVTDAGTGESLLATSPDVLSAQLRLGAEGSGSGLGSLTAWDGDPDAGTEVVLTGTRGRLRLRSQPVEPTRARQPQMTPFEGELTCDGVLTAFAPEPTALHVIADNVARAYQLIARDLLTGSSSAPGLCRCPGNPPDARHHPRRYTLISLQADPADGPRS